MVAAGARSGQVTRRNRVQRLAPSRRAASTSSAGMDCSPATNRITIWPIWAQACTKAREKIARLGSPSQFWDNPASPNPSSRLFNSPRVGS
ncbi:hypothetical protein D3C76_1696150 [compost metagenome]